MNKFFLLVLTLFLVNAASFPTLNIASNTTYQNTNISTLYIYATSNDNLQAYLGDSPKNLVLAINQQIGITTPPNITSTLVVPPKWYYKYIYTSATFKGELVENPIYFIQPPQTQIQKYPLGAQIFFAIGLILSFILLLLFFRIFYVKPSFITSVFGFTLGITATICLVFSLFYTTEIEVSSYTINTSSATLQVQNVTLTSLPLAKEQIFNLIASIFAFVDSIIAFVFFIFNLWRK
ncbi:MAG: hypothetical protein ACP5HJ_01235 [Candidatus Micrarchaeia archaeon]